MRTRFIGAVFLLVVIAVVVGTATALAQPSPSPLEKREALGPVSAQRDRIPQAEGLRQLARERGNVMVIVRMSLPEPFLGEGRLRAEDRGRQRAQIANASRSLERELQQELRSRSAEIYRRFETIPALAMRVNASAFEALLRSPLIEHIQEDEAVPYTLDSSTPVIGAPAVWADGLTGAGQAVVILDTGIDGDHAFFRNASNQSRIVNAACFSNAGGFGGKVSLCPNGQATQLGLGAAEADILACLNGSNQLCHHGSHVAGIAAGWTNTDLKGVAPDAGIIPIQVFTRFNLANDCSPNPAPCVMSYTSDQLAALDHVFNVLHPGHTIASVNMSLGGGSNTTYCDSDSRKPAIDNLASVGIATVIATGNNGFRNAVSTPSCISSAVAVSSTTNADAVSSFSNVHSIMDLFAPGSLIESAIVGDGYALFSGTSMATPHVAGAWAVLRQAAPTASVDQILEALVDTGFMVTDERDEDLVDRVTKPRIQLDDAVAAISLNTWTGTDGNSWNHPGNWTGGSPPTCLQSVVIPASATPHPVLTADAEARDLEIAPNAAVDIGSHTLRLCGSLNTEAGGTLSGIGGTLHFDGTGTTTIAMPEGSRQLHHLRVGNGTDARTLVMSNPLQIAGNLTVEESSTLDSNGHELVFNGTAQNLDMMGPAPFEPVYASDFDSVTGWTVSDINQDGFTWFATNTTSAPNNPNSGQHARYSGNTNATTEADDWLFSPPVALQAGVEYTIRFNYGARSTDYPESMAVWIGNTGSVAAMTTPLFDNQNITSTIWTKGSASFTPDVTTNYHIGFHAYSQHDRWDLAVDDLRVETEGAHTFSRLHIAPNAALTLNSQSALHILGDLEVEGTLRLNGTPMAVEGIVTNTGVLHDTLDVPANPATTEFLHIRNPVGDTLRYRGVEITPTGTALGTTSVEVRGAANCTQNANDPLFRRCFDITPGNAHSANLRFWLSEAERNGQNASTARVFRWNGTGWAEPSVSYQRSSAEVACTSADNQCWVQASAVSDYSPFVLGSGGTPTGSPDAPTAVVMGNIDLFQADVSELLRGLGTDGLEADKLLSLLTTWDPSAAAALAGAGREAILAGLSAYLDPDNDGRVAIFRWETLEQQGTVGFHVQRRQDGRWQTIHAGMLPGMVAAPMGAEYMLADPSARPGKTYEYRLIEIEAWGTTREYGPYRLRMTEDHPE